MPELFDGDTKAASYPERPQDPQVPSLPEPPEPHRVTYTIPWDLLIVLGLLLLGLVFVLVFGLR